MDWPSISASPELRSTQGSWTTCSQSPHRPLIERAIQRAGVTRMNTISTRVPTLLVILLALTISSASQVTGIPPYQSFAGGPDVINLGNLNVHYSIPIFSRGGRGIPFGYGLAYDSSIWQPSAGVWLLSGGGLHRDTAALVGYVGYFFHEANCGGGTGVRDTWRFTNYVDSAGTSHPFSITLYDDTCSGQGI